MQKLWIDARAKKKKKYFVFIERFCQRLLGSNLLREILLLLLLVCAVLGPNNFRGTFQTKNSCLV